MAASSSSSSSPTSYSAQVAWQRNDAEPFVDQRYSRRHMLRFDGGAEVLASSSPHSVPLPYSDASAVDPEELFVAALASCHMLWFLSLAAKGGHVVQRYSDGASGVMARNAQGQLAMTVVTLRPQVEFAPGTAPDAAAFATLHHDAHTRCYIANSVRTDVRCEPVLCPPPLLPR